MLLNVVTLVGEDAITMDDGQLLYEKIHPALLADDKIEIDFTGTDIYASPFLNAAFGQLYKDFMPDELEQRIQITGMPNYALKLLKRVTANARRYYHDSHYYEATNHVLEELAKDA